MRIKVIRGDITKQNVDVIVNATNNRMMIGGGVDGAIHSAAGPSLRLECREIGWCDTGAVRVTKAYKLPAKWIIHTVGPVCLAEEFLQAFKKGVTYNAKDALLATCYRRALEEAVKLGAETIAFPSISTGAYAFPIKRAAQIAHAAVNEFLETDKTIKMVTFVCWEQDDYQAHLELHG